MHSSFIIPRWRALRVVAAGCLVIGAAVAGFAWAQGPGARPVAKPIDTQARDLLNEVSKAYKSLRSYSDQGEFTLAANVGGKPQKQSAPLKITLVKPNLLDLETGVVRLISDGKTLTTSVPSLKRYTAVPAPPEIDFQIFREGPTGAALFGGPPGAAAFILLNFLTASDPAATLAQIEGTLKMAPVDGKADSPQNPSLLIDQEDGPDIQLDIDPVTKLFTGIELKVDPRKLAEDAAAAGQDIKIDRFGWRAGAISTQVAKDRSFAFQPPQDFKKVDSLIERRGSGEEASQFAVNEKLGKPAPDFTLTILDGPSKTRTITKAELAGKVVVINFWATWCAPCIEEMPDIQRLVEDLAKTKKEVVLIALSQDNEPTELAEVRKLVETTLSERKIKLTGTAYSLVGLDPSNTVGQAFDVEGFPTTVILDAKGIVQAAHVGGRTDIREVLSSQIDALLAGKSLARPKDQSVEAAKKPEAGGQ